MAIRGTILVVGASGVVGQAVLRHFSSLADWDAIGVSRRPPDGVAVAKHISVDLTDQEQCDQVFGGLSGVTHVVYAAVYEKPGLVKGWQDPDQMQINLGMLRNVVEPLEAAAKGLCHITILQGGKAYGVHIDPHIKIPAKERWPRHPHDNFYWLQEDFLRDRQPQSSWHWTILRPRLVFGDGLGANMNLLPALGVFAALRREAGLALTYPGGPEQIYQAADSDLIARACAWAAISHNSHNEIFNLSNGDEFVWENVWPVIAEGFGMRSGPAEPEFLAKTMPPREAEWAAIVDKYNLTSPPDFQGFVGQGFPFLDYMLSTGKTGPMPASIVSTIKIRQAGFGDCLDTEDMLLKWIHNYQDRGWLPKR